MKKIYTNGDLLGNIVSWILFILIIIGIFLNSWKGAFQAIGLYVFILVVCNVILQASKNMNIFKNGYISLLKI